MNPIDLEYRMYGLVTYNLSPIQQAIQFGHAVVEYMLNYPIDDMVTNETGKWASEDKTFIILNGGTTNWGNNGYKGSLNQHYESLLTNRIQFSYFKEPDLGDQLTAIVFLVDERVWNKDKYRDFPTLTNGDVILGGQYRQQSYEYWVESVGGEKNVFLREFLKQFKLA